MRRFRMSRVRGGYSWVSLLLFVHYTYLPAGASFGP